jgi:hypothetical protein
MTALCPTCQTQWQSRNELVVCPACGNHELQPQLDLQSVLHAGTSEPPQGQHQEALCGAWVRTDQIAPTFDAVSCPDCLAEREYALNVEL